MMGKLIDKISPGEALMIIQQLAKTDKNIKKKIEEIAEGIVRDVDFENICDDVLSVLNAIYVEDLWDRSGATQYGYVTPEDMAIEMVEEELDPFNQKIFRLCELNMQKEAKLYCMGVLKGIYKYDQESNSEFKISASDVPVECFSYLLDEWKKRNTNNLDVKEMNSFLKKECGKWA